MKLALAECDHGLLKVGPISSYDNFPSKMKIPFPPYKAIALYESDWIQIVT